MKKVGYPIDMNIHISKKDGKRKIDFYRIENYKREKKERYEKSLAAKLSYCISWGLNRASSQISWIFISLSLLGIFTNNSIYIFISGFLMFFSVMISAPIYTMLAFLSLSEIKPFTEIYINIELLTGMMNFRYWKKTEVILHGNKKNYSVKLGKYFWMDYRAVGDWVDYSKIMLVSKKVHKKFWKLKYFTRDWYFKVVFDDEMKRSGYLKLTYA